MAIKNGVTIFGKKPKGCFLLLYTIKKKKKLNQVSKFIEKPNQVNAKKIIKKGGYWNSGMFFLRKDSLINNFKKHQKKIYKNSSILDNQGIYIIKN